MRETNTRDEKYGRALRKENLEDHERREPIEDQDIVEELEYNKRRRIDKVVRETNDQERAPPPLPLFLDASFEESGRGSMKNHISREEQQDMIHIVNNFKD